jgi:hypothetical protein
MKNTALPPTPSEFTKMVAERRFVCRNPEGEHSLRVEFGEPTQDVAVVNGSDWRCPMRITLGPESMVRSIVGIDSLQALQLAIDLARAEIEIIATRPDTVLLYLDEPVDTSQPDWQRSIL